MFLKSSHVKQYKSVTETGASLDHYQPARYLLKQLVELRKLVHDVTIDRFEGLFRRANALLARVD